MKLTCVPYQIYCGLKHKMTGLHEIILNSTPAFFIPYKTAPLIQQYTLKKNYADFMFLIRTCSIFPSVFIYNRNREISE